ncbi:glycosyltransferase family 4 protein [Reichenbachiella ulvae]|uniref:Glycosyltransferase family 4 protein n=1 Tax=Reichenbachiella ulvae TaxID=2980104 RepID=A0ABT3CQ65_9BACT|nr:glycosyltransferase family 4 protein [Reichenbachiella ulvae]MCV9385711.1 glycosyltransferase family 4 protein [Reichenbachiella ulvae]
MGRKILMLLNEPYPTDIRVLKESRSLLEAEFEITLCCLARKDEKLEEEVGGVRVLRLKGSESTAKKGLLDMYLSMTRINPLFSRFLKNLFSKETFDFVHVHDLPLFFTARSVSPVPVFLDLHENYPDALSVWFKWRKNPLIRLKNRMFFNYPHWQKFEQDAVKEADHVIAVVDEMKERLLDQTGLESDKITVVSNMEDRYFLEQEVDPQVFEKYKGRFIVSYTGNVGPHRGVDTLVKSMAFLKDHEDIVVLIIGNCSDDTRSYLESLVEENGLQGRVELWGYRPFHQFYSFMNMSDVNIIPHNKSGHTDHTIPHKLFQAMMVGKPVIVSSCKPLKRTVELSKAGLVFEAENAEDLSKQILRLYQETELYKELGVNAKKATIDGDMNWENEGRKLVELYSHFSN